MCREGCHYLQVLTICCKGAAVRKFLATRDSSSGCKSPHWLSRPPPFRCWVASWSEPKLPACTGCGCICSGLQADFWLGLSLLAEHTDPLLTMFLSAVVAVSGCRLCFGADMLAEAVLWLAELFSQVTELACPTMDQSSRVRGSLSLSGTPLATCKLAAEGACLVERGPSHAPDRLCTLEEAEGKALISAEGPAPPHPCASLVSSVGIEYEAEGPPGETESEAIAASEGRTEATRLDSAAGDALAVTGVSVVSRNKLSDSLEAFRA